MTEYWAIINENQEGPFSLDELMSLDITADTPVWCAGMEAWAWAADIPEIAERLTSTGTVKIPPIPDTPFIPEIPVSGTLQEEPAQVETARNTPGIPAGKCPPTYLVWAILCTIFCCMPLGIPAIIYASQVTSCYRNGDYDGAHERSEKAALWVIISFVVGLTTLPLQIAFSLL